MCRVAHSLVMREGRGKTLLVVFSAMNFVGDKPDSFMCYKKAQEAFPESYDILFVKDIADGLWYLTVMDDVQFLIQRIVKEHLYKRVLALASSSGSIPLLNIMPMIPNFAFGFVINGQTNLLPDMMDACRCFNDCTIFENNCDVADSRWLDPLRNVHWDAATYTIAFLHNQQTSDKLFHEDLVRFVEVSPMARKHIVIMSKTNESLDHCGFIIDWLQNKDNLANLGDFFEGKRAREAFQDCTIL